MAFRDLIATIFTQSPVNSGFSLVPNNEGIRFVCEPALFRQVQSEEGSPLALHQYVHLTMLAEEGLAEPIANGFFMESSVAVQLNDEVHNLLDLPGRFHGTFQVRVSGLANQEKFSVQAIPVLPGGDAAPHFRLRGPLIQLSDSEAYLLRAHEYDALVSLESHRQLPPEQCDEVANLRLIAQLQHCKNEGMDINLSHFNTLQVQDIQRVKLAVEELQNGSLLLLPDYGDTVDLDMVKTRLWQLGDEDSVGSLRVGNSMLVLDEKCVEATREILGNQYIQPEQVRAFLNNPSAFLNGALVDLDEGFSCRVLGATEFTPLYDVDTVSSGIDWFVNLAGDESILACSHLPEIICNKKELHQFRDQLETALQAGKTEVEYKGRRIDVTDPHAVDGVLESVEEALAQTKGTEDLQPTYAEEEVDSKRGHTVLDIYDNNIDVEFGDVDAVAAAQRNHEIDWSAYKLQPYAYQETGIRWILGLAAHTHNLEVEDLGKYGALLADDMGLGKTFMSLAAIKEYFDQGMSHNDKDRPVLVVAPLSLLETWKDEVDKVFVQHHQPFADILTLQADADLPKFRLGGAETRQANSSDLATLRYSLKVGKSYFNDRLDIPRRLVLTTYGTLRDYQFSLARVDWSIIIFDEAQNLKNPDTLTARAAKGLKARFKLIATGTPVENSLRDFWSLMDTAVPAYLGPYQKFKETYIEPINNAAEEKRAEVRLGLGTTLRKKVGPLMLRRNKEDELEGLPRKHIFSGTETTADSQAKNFASRMTFLPLLQCPMSEEQQTAYAMVIGQVTRGEIPSLAGLHQLRDVSLHPGLLNGGVLPMPQNEAEARETIARSGKLENTLALLQDVRERKEKVIIFCINRRLQAFLAIACKRVFGVEVSVINGDTKAIGKRKEVATRKSILKKFAARRGFGVVVMSPIAAGTGLTVVAANNVIHLERHWNPAKEAQATDRVYRIGQTRDVKIYLPILVDPRRVLVSFDENLNRLLQKKTALKDAVVTPEKVKEEELASGLFGAVAESVPKRPLH